MQRLQKPLLICGLLTLVVFVLTDALAGTLWDGYNFTTQSINELSAIGAPTRPLVVLLNLIYYALAIAFGLGVGVYGRARQTRITPNLNLANFLQNFVLCLFDHNSLQEIPRIYCFFFNFSLPLAVSISLKTNFCKWIN
jgi:hypothetical protein